MRNILIKTTTLFCMLFLAWGNVTGLAAGPGGSKENKTYSKLKSEIDNAGPHDWRVFSDCASKLIRKGINMKEAYEWLQISLAIERNTTNLIVLGDYYRANELPFDALNCYTESLKVGLKMNIRYKDYETTQKIKDLTQIVYH